MQDFPSNSQKAKATDAPREKLRPVTSAETRERKRGIGRQFKQTFFSGNPRDAFGSMVEDVVVPAIRDTLYNALQDGLEHLIFGDRARRRPRSSGIMSDQSAGPRVNYGGMSTSPKPTPSTPRMLSQSARARHDFTDLVIPSQQAATEVLDQMYETLSRFGEVTVANLYELTGIRAEHTDMKWGWTSLRGAKAMRLRQGGYLLDLPEPEPLR